MIERLRRIADSTFFQNFVTAVIVLAGIVVGMETYPAIVERYESILHLVNQIILVIFVAEVVIKIGAEGSRPQNYFKDAWNIFDFAIVAVSLLPIGGSSVTVLRLLRLLRVLRLFKALPRLQVLVGALLKSIPSMFYVTLLLLLLFYVYAVAATFLFGANDPIHFGTLHISMLSLFRAVTLEDWTDLMYIQMYGCEGYGYGGSEALCIASSARPALGAAFFVSFVLLGTMIILNLFVGVIMKGMDEAQAEADAIAAAERAGVNALSVEQELEVLESQLATLADGISRARRAASHASGRVHNEG
jgi:voltage-gated sodium channel